MAARYDFRKVPSKKGNGEEPKLYPHIVSGGTIRTRTILEEISEASTFTVGDLEGVLCALTEKISKYLVDGYHVELGKIGYFSASLKATHPVKDKKRFGPNPFTSITLTSGLRCGFAGTPAATWSVQANTVREARRSSAKKKSFFDWKGI